MSKRVLFTISLCGLLFSTPALPHIYETKCIASVLQQVKNEEGKSKLFIFDINKTILVPKHFQLFGKKKFVEPCTSTVIHTVQQKYPSIALTKCSMKSCQKRIRSLHKRGIAFTNSFLNDNKITRPANILHGIIRCDDCKDKGIILVTAFKLYNYHPDEVVFIDDSLYNLENVERALNAFDPTIKFTGIHYTHITHKKSYKHA
jgi:histidinol phosphatase-like enzyme